MKINRIFKQDKNREIILGELCDYLQQEYALRAYFCRISGKRWAFMAGSRKLEIPRHRIVLNDNTGLVVERISHLKPGQWEEILKTIKSNI